MDKRFTSASSVDVLYACVGCWSGVRRLFCVLVVFDSGDGAGSGFLTPRKISIDFLNGGINKYSPPQIITVIIALYKRASVQENLDPLNGFVERAHLGLINPNSKNTTRKTIIIWYIFNTFTCNL